MIAPDALIEKYRDIDTDLPPARSDYTDETRCIAKLMLRDSARPIYGQFNLTVFNEQWKLVQEVVQDQLTTTVTNHLFHIGDDPNEYNNLASAHPDVVSRWGIVLSGFQFLSDSAPGVANFWAHRHHR